MANDDISNLSSNMAALTKQLEKNNAAMLLGSQTIKNQNKDFEQMLDNSIEMESSSKKVSGYFEEMHESLKGALSSTLKLSNTLTSIGTAAFTANIVKDLINIDDRMTAVSVRMGKGHAGIKSLKDSVHGLQKDFGASYESAIGLVEELASAKYVGNIKDAAAGINLFSRATGVSETSVLELTNNLSKMGGLGTDSINAMYAGMIKVQQSVGISDKGMTALTNSIHDMAMNMAAFGKSDQSIKRMAAETTALVGAMEKVGISASRSTQLIEQLTDPDRIEENILLYSQLGISLEDAMSGEIDRSQLDSQFKDMADRVTQMGPIAGAQFAKSMGMSYKEVTRMAKMEAGEAQQIAEKALTPEDQALETMKALEKSTEGIGKRFETAFNKMEGTLKSLPTALLVGLAVVAPLLIRQGKKIFHKIFDKREIQASVADAVVPSLENSFRKAGGIIKGETAKLGNTIKGNFEQWFDSTAVGGFFGGIETQTDALMARFNQESFADKFLASARENALDDVEAQLTNIDAQMEKIFSGLGDLGVEKITIDENTGGLNYNNLGLDKKQQKVADALNKSYEKLNRTQIALEKRKSKMLTKEQALQKVAEATKILEEKKQKSAEAAVKIKEAQKRKEQKIIDIGVEIAKLEKDKSGMTKKQEEAVQAKIDALGDEKKLIEDMAKIESDRLSDEEKAAKAEEEAANKNVEDAQGVADGKSDSRWKNGFTKIAAGIGNKISTAFNNTTLGKNIAERSGQRGLGVAKAVGKTAAGAAGKVGVGALKGIGKGIAGIAKSFGPVAIVASIAGKLLSKIQEPLEKAMDVIVDKLSPIAEAFLEPISILMNVVAKSIMPLALTILSGILKVLHFILKPVVGILHLLGHLPGKIGEAAKGIGDAIDAATGPEVTDALATAADNLSNTSIDLKGSSENLNEAATAEESDGPKVFNAVGGTFTTAGYSDPQQQANSRMTSTTVVTSNSESKEDLKKYEDEKKEKAKDEKLEGINNNTSGIPKLVSLFEELLELLTGQDVNITSVDPDILGINLNTSK